MSQYKHAEIADTVYFWFALNTTAGEADDGATPTYVIRLAGAASDAAPTSGPTAATLLSEGTYYAGLHEIAYDTTGDAAGEYAVFCTAVVSTVNPAGFVGSYTLRTAGTAALDVNVTSIAADAITPASVDEDADFVIQALSITNQLDAGSVVVDAGVDVVGVLSANSLLIDTTTTLSGNVSLGGTLGVTGITTFTGAVNANITGDITGNLSGSVGSLTGHTGQSADNNTILANATYGLAKLVRSTVPANTLDVSATGEAGLDFANIKDATGAHTLTNITVPTVTTTGTCTTNSDLVSAAAVKTALEADGGDLSSLMEALVNKAIWTELDGQLEMHNDSDVSQGTIAAQIATDGTFTTRKRAYIAAP